MVVFMFETIVIPVLLFIGLGLVAGILLSIFSKIFAVKTNEQVEEVLSALPGLNCGVCGYKGCENYANEMVFHAVATNKCVPGGDETSRKISTLLGIDFEDVIEQVAYVKCGGTVPHATEDSYVYQGEKTCAACNMYYQGKGVCDYGCIGFGDCAARCAYGAITIVDEVAVINEKLCRGCSMCVAVCPKNLISIRQQRNPVFVACSSCNSTKTTMKKCMNGCIGCKKCERVCPSGAITVENNLASIDYEKCTGCLECAKGCPKKCITVYGQDELSS